MIHITENSKPDIHQLPFELVERKGVGHPDTICDAIAERASVYYSRYFLDHYEKVAHHWFDKVMLIGGCADFKFGEGKITAPYRVIFAGKAAKTYKGVSIPLDRILWSAADDVLSEVLTGFEASEHLTVINEIVDYQGAGRLNSRYQPKSENDLVSLDHNLSVSNDCNLLSAYAPLSNLERLVLHTEQYLNGEKFKTNHPETGWDIKIVGSREYNTYKLLINIPFLAQRVSSVDEYFACKAEITHEIEHFISEAFDFQVELSVNPQDKNQHYYLTVLGSVADTGDVGVVGRGNRINGLITPMRSMSIEAPAGKNPMDHTGKIYGVLAQKLALKIYDYIEKAVEVHVFTSKEAPMNEPDHISVQISGWVESQHEKEEITQMICDCLNEVNSISKNLIINGEIMW